MSSRSSHTTWLADVVEATAVFLFFYQALRVLFSVLFGLIYDALFAEIVPMTTVGLILVVVILALLGPLAAPRQPRRRQATLLVGAVVVFLARIPLTVNDPQVRLVASILIVASTGLYLATRLLAGPPDVARALVLALVVDQLLRAAGHTWDVTLREAWWPGQMIVSLALCLVAGWHSRLRIGSEVPVVPRVGLAGGLAWGAWLFLQTSLLAFPNALARWSGVSYAIVAPLLVAVTVLPLLPAHPLPIRLGPLQAVADLVVLLLSLALGNLLNIPALALLLLLLAQWICLRMLFADPTAVPGAPMRRFRVGIAAGGILFLVLSFAYAFTFTYPYTLDLFRGLGLPVVLVGGLFATLPGLGRFKRDEPTSQIPRVPRPLVWALGAVSVALVVVLAWPRATGLPMTRNSLRAATYNMHYGYDTDWHLSLEAQARAIEQAGADVVALQEVDTGRPTSYMIDDAEWLACRLDMEVAYLPTMEHLTGIALLSRYPVVDSEMLLLPSELEQTGIVWARLDIGDNSVNAFAIWMGLEPEERARQLNATLPFLAAHAGPAVFGGDFNSTPDSPVYARLADAGWVDPFAALGLGSPPTDPAVNPTKRIDFVWLRGLAPLAAQVADSTASDHRLVVVEVALP